MSQNFGAYLREVRLRQKFGLRELARCVEITPSYLCHLEKGDKYHPSEELVLRLAAALRTDEQVLLMQADIVPKAVRLFLLRDPSMFALVARMRRLGLKGRDVLSVLDKKSR